MLTVVSGMKAKVRSPPHGWLIFCTARLTRGTANVPPETDDGPTVGFGDISFAGVGDYACHL